MTPAEKHLHISAKSAFDSIEKHTREFLQNEPPMSLKQLKVNGSDISQLGFTGKEIGKALNFLLEQVVNGNCENEKDSLLALIENNYL